MKEITTWFKKQPHTTKLVSLLVVIALAWAFLPFTIWIGFVLLLRFIPNRNARFILVLLTLPVCLYGQLLWTRRAIRTPVVTPTPIVSVTPTPEVLGENLADKIFLVTKIIDGDTFEVTQNNEEQIVRLIGIDTPEKGDCYFSEASSKLEDLILNQNVRLEADPTQTNIDRYQRLLRYAFLENNLNVGREMIATGFAREYTYDKPYTYQATYLTAQSEAQNSELGIWNQINCPATTIILTPTPEITIASVCSCEKNTYDCGDFTTQSTAQACFEFCGGKEMDVHVLDTNKDGRACESLP